MNTDLNSFETLLIGARAGDESAVSRLLEAYRHYLQLLARIQLYSSLQARVSPSDIAQETMIAARAAFPGFGGQTENELIAWLRKVLASRLVDATRFHFAQRRDVAVEQRLSQSLDRSSIEIGVLVADAQNSPSQIAAHREQAMILSEALQRLPETYSEVIVQRHLEGRSFSEIAATMKRSVPSIKGIWSRAMTRLRVDMDADAS